MSAPLRRRAFASRRYVAPFSSLSCASLSFARCQRFAFVLALDLHHEESAARGGGCQGLGDRHHSSRVFDIARGQRALGGGQQSVGNAHQAALGERVARIELQRTAEQVHGVASGRRGELAALQGRFGLRQLLAQSFFEREDRRRRRARRNFFGCPDHGRR